MSACGGPLVDLVLPISVLTLLDNALRMQQEEDLSNIWSDKPQFLCADIVYKCIKDA